MKNENKRLISLLLCFISGYTIANYFRIQTETPLGNFLLLIGCMSLFFGLFLTPIPKGSHWLPPLIVIVMIIALLLSFVLFYVITVGALLSF